MRAVIADDFTGAVEIGGVAARYGLRAEIQTEFCPESDAEIVVVDTDSRSLSPNEAAARVAALAAALGDTLFFKKTDSVLRGPVVAELSAALSASGRSRALLAPANPALRRTIRGGRYYIDDEEIHRTDFARDPEYPAASSEVLSLLGRSEGLPASVLTLNDSLPGSGIMVGEADCPSDLDAWAGRLDARTLPAGGSGFFESILGSLGTTQPSAGASVPDAAPGRSLFVCGSCCDRSRQSMETMRQSGVPVLRMPAVLFDGGDAREASLLEWSDSVLRALQASGVAVMAIDRPPADEPGAARRLRGLQIAAAKQVLAGSRVDQLFVEGGSTASALVRAMGWNRMQVADELATGVVRVRCGESANALLLTIKPGSYQWPFGLPALTRKQRPRQATITKARNTENAKRECD